MSGAMPLVAAGSRGFRARWYVLAGLREALPLFAVYALFMQASGSSPVEISALLAIWSIGAFLFEVPSGVFADRFDRVWVLAASRLIQAAAFVVWWLWPQFGGFALGFLLWGLAGALWSGTNEAWLYEALQAGGASERFESIYAVGSACASLGVCVGLASGGILAALGYGWVFGVSILGCLGVAVLTRLWLPSVPRVPGETTTEQTLALAPLRAAIGDFRREPAARHAALALACGFVFFACFEEYVGLVFDEGGVPLVQLGLAYAACYAARAAAQAALGRVAWLAQDGEAVVALLWSGLWLGGGAVILAIGGNAFALFLGVLGYFAASGIAEVRIVNALQRHQSGDGRATMMSLARLGLLAAGPVVYAAIGGLATAYGWLSSVWFAALGTGVVALLLLLLRKSSAVQ